MTNEEIRDRILRNYAQFVSDVDPDRLSDWLKQEGIVTVSEFQEISGRFAATQSRCRALLDHLLTKMHPRTFLVIRNALEYEGHYLLKYVDSSQEGNNTSKVDTENSDALRLAFEAGRNENQSEKLEQTKRNRELEQKVFHLERQALSDSMKIRELDETLERVEVEHRQEIQHLRRQHRDMEHRLNSGRIVICDLEHKLDQERKRWAVEKDNLLKQLASLSPNSLNEDPVDDVFYGNAALVRTIRTRASENENKGIYGVAILDQELFVANRMSPEIEVFDSQTFVFKRRVVFESLMNPEDIATCKKNKILFISDWKYFNQPKEILRIDRHGVLTMKWLTGEDGGSLSVSEEGTVLLSVKNRNVIKEYSLDGDLIRDVIITMDSGIVHPLHSMKLSDGNVVVCYGDIDDPVHGLCLINDNGKSLKSNGELKRSSLSESFTVPSYITEDRKGSILVLDTNNKRILVFNNRLDLKGEIMIGSGGLVDPHRMATDTETGRIFIADNMMGWRDGRILVFDIIY